MGVLIRNLFRYHICFFSLSLSTGAFQTKIISSTYPHFSFTCPMKIYIERLSNTTTEESDSDTTDYRQAYLPFSKVLYDLLHHSWLLAILLGFYYIKLFKQKVGGVLYQGFKVFSLFRPINSTISNYSTYLCTAPFYPSCL